MNAQRQAPRPAADVAGDAKKLRLLAAMIQETVETVIEEWSSKTNQTTVEKSSSVAQDEFNIPSHKLYQAQRVLAAAAGSIEELVSDPSLRLIGFSTQYWESRALHIAAEHRLADLMEAGVEAGASDGVHVNALAAEVGIEAKKLSRVLRCLASQHIFQEVALDRFANNRVSKALVNNEPLRAYIMLFALDIFTTADCLPVALKDPVLGPSYRTNETAFNLALGTSKSRWQWLEEQVHQDSRAANGGNSRGYPRLMAGFEAHSSGKGSSTEGTTTGPLVPRPELAIFGLAMVGGGRLTSTPHLFDYPWQDLGSGATVVDVGGGQGGFSMQLSRLYPGLVFVVQDSPSMIEQARAFWEKENPDAHAQGRVRLMPHDFFAKNPVEGADVYWLRYILHDWSDDYCVEILSSIRASMGPTSRILIADQVMNTTAPASTSSGSTPAPEPLLPNYGHYIRYSHQRDLAMMGLINGIERTPSHFEEIVERAGLRIVKIWECRTQVSLVECRLL